MMFDVLGAEFALEVEGTQLFVPVLPEGAVARTGLGWLDGMRGEVEARGAVLGARTVGMRTMLVPLELRPYEEIPRLAPEMLEVPRDEEEPSEMPREEVEPDEEALEEDPLDLAGLTTEPMELPLLRELLPLVLLPLELEPRETLPRELEPRELLPLELLCDALLSLEPRCAWAGASRARRREVRMRVSCRIWRIAAPFGAVRMRDGSVKRRGSCGARPHSANRVPNSPLSPDERRNTGECHKGLNDNGLH